MSGALIELARPTGAPTATPQLIAEVPAAALRLVAAIGHNRWPLVLEPLASGVELRALCGWGFVELTCREAWAAEGDPLLLPVAPVRSALGRASDAAVASLCAADDALLLRLLGPDAAVACLLAKDHSDAYGSPPVRAAGAANVKVSPTFLAKVLNAVRLLTDEVELEVSAPDEPVTIHFAAPAIGEGRILLAPIHRDNNPL